MSALPTVTPGATPPIVTGATPPIATGTTTATTPTTAGVGTTPTTMEPAATTAQTPAAEDTRCCGSIRDCVSKIVEFVRSCLAKIPLIGRLFAKEETVEVPNTPQPVINPPTEQFTDAQRLDMVRAQFRLNTVTHTFPVPAAETVNHVLDIFRAMSASPAVQMQAFQEVLAASNSTDDIARQFYNALSSEIKTQFRHQIYVANSSADDGHGLMYGEHMVATAIRGPLAQMAAAALQAILAAPAPAPVCPVTPPAP